MPLLLYIAPSISLKSNILSEDFKTDTQRKLVPKLSKQGIKNLDDTFRLLFIVVSLMIASSISVYTFREVRHPAAEMGILFFYFPMIMLVLLWWCAVFFDITSLKIVSWYGLFYFVVHAFLEIMRIYILVAYGELYYHSFEEVGFVLRIFSGYLTPVISTVFIYRKYSCLVELSFKRVCVGIFIFIAITFGLILAAL